ncbi:hypothetical protein QTV49_001711 [Vibrio vulnificus]|nr:hypothetical protein [Vibrio vulnificus]
MRFWVLPSLITFTLAYNDGTEHDFYSKTEDNAWAAVISSYKSSDLAQIFTRLSDHFVSSSLIHKQEIEKSLMGN